MGRTVDELVEMSDSEDKKISIRQLEKQPDLKERVIALDSQGVEGCWISFIVDDGDKKVGKGDLFLEGHRSCLDKNDKDGPPPTLGFAKFFGSREMICSTVKKSGKKVTHGTKTEKPSKEVKNVITAIEKFKGQSYEEVIKQIKTICPTEEY